MDAAVDDRFPLRVYKASAGSGKTFRLAVEYISLLALDPMAYRHILAVTFTNKATAEMKQRIVGTLYGLAHGLREAEPYVDAVLENIRKSAHAVPDVATLRQRAGEALGNILHDYDRFHVETIDAFFQRIVRDLAGELELPMDMKVELDEGKVLSEAVETMLEEMKEGSTEWRTIVDMVEERMNSQRSWRVEDVVAEFGRNIFKECFMLHSEAERVKMVDVDALRQYKEMVERLAEERREALAVAARTLMDAYEECGLADNGGTKQIFTFLTKVVDNKVREDKRGGTFSTSIYKYVEDVETWFKKGAKGRALLQEHVERVLMPMLAELWRLHEVYVLHMRTAHAIRTHLYSLMLLGRIATTVREQNEHKHRFMLAETADLLRRMIDGQDIPFIYEKWGAVMEHVMIDEFQDTSALQWDNFKPLVLNAVAAGGTCLIVGDVKQSIYRFRNSDWKILNQLGDDPDLRRSMECIPAEWNFRSSEQVVRFNNEFFANVTSVLQSQCPAIVTAYGDVEQRVKRGLGQGFVRVEDIDYHGVGNDEEEAWEYAVSPDYAEATLQRLGESVKDLLNAGVRADDMAILVRYNKHVTPICEYFRTHSDLADIKVVSDEAFKLEASEAVTLIVCALRVMAMPTEKLYLATLAYRYQRMCGTSEDGLLPAIIEDTEAFLPQGFKAGERAKIAVKPLVEMIEEIYQVLDLNRMEGQDAYLFYFFDVVGKFCEDNTPLLDTFIKAWDEELSQKTIPAGTVDGVRIMTLHKSKGLEFHSVLIPFCSWECTPRSGEILWCEPRKAPYDAMPLLPVTVSHAKDSIFDADLEDENLRTLVDNVNLLYVAFTRARNNLVVLTGNELKKRDKHGADSPCTAQTLLEQAMPQWMDTSDQNECVVRHEHGSVVPSEKETTEDDVPATERQERNPMDETATPTPVSATFVSHPLKAEFRQSSEAELFLAEDSPDHTLQQRARRLRLVGMGNLYHQVLQRIHNGDDVPRAIRQLLAQGCFSSTDEAREIETHITKALGSIADTYPEWFSPEWQVMAERSILADDGQGTFSVYRPDRVVVQGDKAIVIDYKTSESVGAQASPSHIRQVERYKQQLSQLGYKHVQGYLWYLLKEQVVTV